MCLRPWFGRAKWQLPYQAGLSRGTRDAQSADVTEDRDEATGVAAVAALAALVGVVVAAGLALLALAGWHLPV